METGCLREVHSRTVALVIEDDPTLRTVLAYNLEREGYEFMAADDGHAGIAAARSAGSRVSVVVLDRMLPGIDGLSVLRHLRADPTTAEATIVVMSAYGGDEGRTAALAAGADAFLAKPFALEALMAHIRRIG